MSKEQRKAQKKEKLKAKKLSGITKEGQDRGKIIVLLNMNSSSNNLQLK